MPDTGYTLDGGPTLVRRWISFFWSWRRDLNPRPSDYKSDALPAELRQPEHFRELSPGLQAERKTPIQIERLAHAEQGCNRPISATRAAFKTAASAVHHAGNFHPS